MLELKGVSMTFNMGTVNERTFASMLAAGKAANENGKPSRDATHYEQHRSQQYKKPVI